MKSSTEQLGNFMDAMTRKVLTEALQRVDSGVCPFPTLNIYAIEAAMDSCDQDALLTDATFIYDQHLFDFVERNLAGDIRFLTNPQRRQILQAAIQSSEEQFA